MKGEREKHTGISRSLVISLFLHGLLLAGLGVGAESSLSHETGVMVTYLAVPAAMSERALDSLTDPQKKTLPEPVKARPEIGVKPDLERIEQKVKKKSIIQDGAEPPGPEDPEYQVESALPDAASTEEALNNTPYISESQPFPSPDPEALRAEPDKETASLLETGADGVETVDPVTSHHPSSHSPADQPRRTGAPDTSLLAFAGDPASLGIVGASPRIEGSSEARILMLPEPVYPVFSRKRGEEGRVVLELQISAEGTVLGAKIITSSSYSRLDRAAVAAVVKASFVPARAHGSPVESVTKVAYRFELEK